MKTFLSLVIFLILSIHSSSWVVAGADHEGLTYGIRVNDSMSRINKQSKKYNLKAERFNITSEDGKLVGIRLIRDKKTVLIAALFKDRVRWTDVLSKGTKINGIEIGTALFEYAQKGMPITFYGHRDSSLDDIICSIGDNKESFLINNSYWSKIKEYQATSNRNILKLIVIKGVEIKE